MVTSMSENDAVLYEVSERIATVTMNRPEARNALSSAVLKLLPQRLEDAEADPEVDVVILTGTDPAFSAGLDFKELGSSARNGAPFPHPPHDVGPRVGLTPSK